MRYVQETSFPKLRRRGEPPPPARACPNCGTRVDDRYCPRCGQRNRERLVSLRAIVAEAVEDQLSLGGALPRTLGGLLLHPGLLTREYVAGRIARYIPPLKLYLAASVLFFVVASFVAGFDTLWEWLGPRIEEAGVPPAAGVGAPGAEPKYVLVRSGLDTMALPRWVRPAARYYLSREDRLNQMPPREGVRVLYEAVERNVPRIVFLVVPLFALFLKALYRRRTYVEHFVFVLHLHAFAFLLATAVLLAPHRWVLQSLTAWFMVYLFLALRRVYGRAVLRTLPRYVALLAGYQFVLGLSVAAVMVLAILTA